jgi:hypothetical protein
MSETIADLERQLAEAKTDSEYIYGINKELRTQLTAALDRLREVAGIVETCSSEVDEWGDVEVRADDIRARYGPTLADGLGEAIDAANSNKPTTTKETTK